MVNDTVPSGAPASVWTSTSQVPAVGIARRDDVVHSLDPTASVAVQTSLPSRFHTCLMLPSPLVTRDHTHTVVPAGKLVASPTISCFSTPVPALTSADAPLV